MGSAVSRWEDLPRGVPCPCETSAHHH